MSDNNKVIHIYDWRRPRKPGTLIFEIAMAIALCVWIVSLMALALG